MADNEQKALELIAQADKKAKGTSGFFSNLFGGYDIFVNIISVLLMRMEKRIISIVHVDYLTDALFILLDTWCSRLTHLPCF